MIDTEAFKFIRKFDRESAEQKGVIWASHTDECVSTLLSMLGKVSKDHVVQYTLVLLDDLINADRSRVKAIHEVACRKSLNIWSIFSTSLLNRDDKIVMHLASRLLTKLASWDRVRCPEFDLFVLLEWTKKQIHEKENEYMQSVVECVQWLMRVDDYRMPFINSDGINSVVSVLLTNPGYQLQYQLIFVMWLLSFQGECAEKINDSNVVPVLADILRDSQKEKVTRIIIATFLNMLVKPVDARNACVSLIQSKCLPVLTRLSEKEWADEDITADLDQVLEKLNASVEDLTTWDEYAAEVKSGRLEWSPVHKQDGFWRQNACKVTDNNYELLKLLVKLLQQNDSDATIQAIACHDLGEFIRHYPRGKKTFDALGGKELVMIRMTHDHPAVKYEALLAVQKMMVHNWEFLERQVKQE